jgi:hypothetical protein
MSTPVFTVAVRDDKGSKAVFNVQGDDIHTIDQARDVIIEDYKDLKTVLVAEAK